MRSRTLFRLLPLLLLALGSAREAAAQACLSTQGSNEYCKALTPAVRFGFPRYATAALPTCNTSNKGAVAFDTTAGSYKGCDGSTWAVIGFSGGAITSPILAPAADNCASVPYSFTGDTNTGVCSSAADTVVVYTGGSRSLVCTAGNCEWYYSYTDASNYQRGALKTSASGIEIAAETAGSGADNLNLTLTPAGDGVVYVGGNGASALGGGPVLSGVGNIFYLGIGGQPWVGINASGNLDSTFGKGFTFAGVAGITYLGAAKLAIGTTTTGDFTGALALNAIGLGTTDTATGSVAFVEQTAPAAPAANGARLYAKDNGAGKTQLCVLFATGAEQCFATEP